MLRPRSTIAFAVLCAFALSAFAVQSAGAEQKAFTCEEAAPNEFSDAHCVTENVAGPYGHAEIPNSVFVSATNERTAVETTAAAVSTLKGSLSGVVTEIQCTTVAGFGKVTNAAASVSGTGILEYSGCTVTKPAGKGCVVSGGGVTTKNLAATTVGQAANTVRFAPFEGAEFASVRIESCSVGVLNNTFPVTGALIATANGGTLNTAHAGVTTQNTLRFGGTNVGLEGSITLSGLVAAPAAVTLT